MANVGPLSATPEPEETTFPQPRPVKSAPLANGVVGGVLAIGLLVTGIVTWTSWSLNNHNEDRLLKLQTEQAAEVLRASVPDTEAPLATALEIASATNGNVVAFRRFMSSYVGTDSSFVSASLWQMAGASPRQIAVVAAAPDFATSAQEGASVKRASVGSQFVVSRAFHGQLGRLVFALALPGADRRFAVYAEHAIPADRQSAVAKNSAFSDLYYAIYFGNRTAPTSLLTTSLRHFPQSEPTARVTVPIGTSALTLLTAPRGRLGGTLPARLPWILALLGVLLTLTSAWIAGHLVRRRRSAERDAEEIGRLYGELGAAYGQQRTIAETLQRALLPRETPDIDGMEVAVQYVPGAKGMEMGGDWYSVIALDEAGFAFVVGDVSGRGLSAATVMAGLRFTIRTYFLEGYSPSAILEKCAKQLHVLSDGHFATVLVGIGNVVRHELTLANAGHFNPLVIDGEASSFIETVVGLPLGVSGGAYQSVTTVVPPGATVIAFTDGLVEHRSESLDVGLKRLEEATRGVQGPLDELLNRVISDLTDEASEDDIAVLGLRWKS